MSTAAVASWGRYPRQAQTAHAVHWRTEVGACLQKLVGSAGTTLPYGNGRSYGDSCLADSGHVLHMRRLDRLIEADWLSGRIVVEPGVTLEEVLAVALPRGWFLPVTPGTKFVTVGGAVANDVHGKNHHVRGTFGRHVTRIGLVRSDRAEIVCSPQVEAELFRASIGGLGLTGVMTWVELSLVPIRSSSLEVTNIRFGSVDEFFALSDEFDAASHYTVAWVDCLARGAAAGRGVFSAADHADSGGLEVSTAKPARVPFTPPFSMVNRATVRLFNSLYYRCHRSGRERQVLGYEQFFYPLDRLLEWNRIYGPRGFQQYQCVIPERDARAAVIDLLREVAAAGRGSMLAVLKKCGGLPSPGIISFPLRGVSLALDFPQQERLSADLFARLDSIVRAARGRLYPAKDAHMSAEDFRAAYPGWSTLERLRDPALCSSFWRRVAGR